MVCQKRSHIESILEAEICLGILKCVLHLLFIIIPVVFLRLLRLFFLIFIGLK
jgi:hypothetical protein